MVLLEFEIRPVEGAVVQLHHKLTACTCPGFLSLPDVCVRISAGIVGKRAGTGRNRLFNAIQGCCRVAGDRL